MKNIFLTLILLSPLAFGFENDQLSDEEYQATKEFEAQISAPFIINALDTLNKCVHYHIALGNVMNSFEPKITSIQGYTTEALKQKAGDYGMLAIKIEETLTWAKSKRSMRDDFLLYTEMIFIFLEEEKTLKNIEGEIMMCKNIESFLNSTFK